MFALMCYSYTVVINSLMMMMMVVLIHHGSRDRDLDTGEPGQIRARSHTGTWWSPGQ